MTHPREPGAAALNRNAQESRPANRAVASGSDETRARPDAAVVAAPLVIAPGILVLNGGLGRWVVWDDSGDDDCPVFDTKDRAILAGEQLAVERAARGGEG